MGERAWDHGARFVGMRHRCRSCGQFQCPIAGALFALEVILRHFALHAFAPIVIASVAGAVVHQIAFGDQVNLTYRLPLICNFTSNCPPLWGWGWCQVLWLSS